MITGQALTLADREFIAPPAPFCVMRKYAAVFNGDEVATPQLMAEVVLTSLQRNYPELTQEEFEAKYLDISNIGEAFKAVMTTSGTKEKTPGEVRPGKK